MTQGPSARKSKSLNNAAKAAPAAIATEFKPPLKPHRGLFIGLLLIFAVWVGVLLYLFFATVWPLRHSISATRTALP